jgi:hypothetical protein
MELYDARRDGLSGIRIRDDQGNVVVWIEQTIGLGRKVRQQFFESIQDDTTLTSETFTDLLSRTLTTLAGNLSVTVSVSSSTSDPVGDVVFRLVLDGTPIDDCGVRANLTAANEANGVSITKVVSVAAGSHTVKLQWRSTNAAATAQIRPTTQPDYEHCSMTVEEVE